MQVFEIAPPGARPLWLIVPVLLLLVGVLIMLVFMTIGPFRARFEVSEAGLRLRGDLYGRSIPAAVLRVAAARRVDLDGADRDLRPRWRTFGTGLPGYQSGWFRLRNGEKALLYLSDRSKAVFVPTDAGYSLLLSPDRPEEFLSALRKLEGRRGP